MQSLHTIALNKVFRIHLPFENGSQPKVLELSTILVLKHWQDLRGKWVKKSTILAEDKFINMEVPPDDHRIKSK